jgi:hypothetical protein
MSYPRCRRRSPAGESKDCDGRGAVVCDTGQVTNCVVMVGGGVGAAADRRVDYRDQAAKLVMVIPAATLLLGMAAANAKSKKPTNRRQEFPIMNLTIGFVAVSQKFSAHRP